jgi:O-antigen/teichoic acid export membrane protein
MYWVTFYKKYNSLIKEFGKFDSKSFSVGQAIIDNKSLWTYQIFSSLYNRSEIFIVRALLNFTQIGIYGVGYIFFRNVGIISLAISSIYYPKFSQEYNLGSRINVKRIIIESTVVNFAVGIIMMIITYPLVTWFITHFFGDKYFAAIDIAEILLIGFPFILSSQNSGNFINVISKTKIAIRVSTSILILNLLLNFIFIGGYGLKATAIITVASEMIYSIILLIYSIYFIGTEKNNIYDNG